MEARSEAPGGREESAHAEGHLADADAKDISYALQGVIAG